MQDITILDKYLSEIAMDDHWVTIKDKDGEGHHVLIKGDGNEVSPKSSKESRSKENKANKEEPEKQDRFAGVKRSGQDLPNNELIEKLEGAKAKYYAAERAFNKKYRGSNDPSKRDAERELWRNRGETVDPIENELIIRLTESYENALKEHEKTRTAEGWASKNEKNREAYKAFVEQVGRIDNIDLLKENAKNGRRILAKAKATNDKRVSEFDALKNAKSDADRMLFGGLDRKKALQSMEAIFNFDWEGSTAMKLDVINKRIKEIQKAQRSKK